MKRELSGDELTSIYFLIQQAILKKLTKSVYSISFSLNEYLSIKFVVLECLEDYERKVLKNIQENIEKHLLIKAGGKIKLFFKVEHIQNPMKMNKIILLDYPLFLRYVEDKNAYNYEL